MIALSLHMMELMNRFKQLNPVQIIYRQVPVFQAKSRVHKYTYIHIFDKVPCKCHGKGIAHKTKPMNANTEYAVSTG